MRRVALVSDHEKGLVVAVVHLGDEHGAVDYEAGLVELVVVAPSRGNCVGTACRGGVAEVLVGNALVQVGIQVGILEDDVRRTVELVGTVPDNHIGDSSIAVTDLCVEGGGSNLDLLHSFWRRRETCVGRTREPFGRIVWNAVECQAVVTRVAVRVYLHRNAAERVGEPTGLALEVATGAAVENADGQGRHYVWTAAFVGDVGHFLCA